MMSNAESIEQKVLAKVQVMIRELGHDVPNHADNLNLSSLEVLLLHERIEDELHVRIPAKLVFEDNFSSVSAITNLVLKVKG